MVGKWESGNWLIFGRSAGDGFKLPSIASLPFETVLAHIDGGREWCLQPTNNNNSLRILDRKLFLGFHDKLYVETAI